MKDIFKNLIKGIIYRYYYYTKSNSIRYVYFDAWDGKYSDNPRAISEKLHEMKADSNILWHYNGNENQIPSYNKIVSGVIQNIKAMAQASVWVFCHEVPTYVVKKKDILYIQTWHGDRGFKECGVVAEKSMGKKFSFNTGGKYIETKGIDYLVVGSDFGEEQLPKFWGYEGVCLKYGCPRNDKLVNISDFTSEASIIKKKIGINDNMNVLLYAPTFRDSKANFKDYYIDLKRTISLLNKSSNKWICLVRAHQITGSFETEGLDVIDVTSYPDMADLLLITDLLISDFSSCLCDFVLTGKPAIQAVFDLDDFVKRSRHLLMNLEDVGYPIVKTQKELDYLIENIDKIDFKKINNKVNKYYGTKETGKASERVANIIIDWINKQYDQNRFSI